MQKPVPFLTDKKYSIWRKLCLVVVLLSISFGHIPVIMTDLTMRPLFYVNVLVITVLFTTSVFFNIYWSIPRLLLRNKYASYIGVLAGITVFCVFTPILLEWIIIKVYQLPATDYRYFADNVIQGFVILSCLIAYSFSMIATSLFVFMRHWWKTGERIHYLEETGVSVELEKARNRIDSDALLNVLNRAASVAVAFPNEAISMLMALGKSLRRQLYESDRKQVFPTNKEETRKSFGEQHRILDFLIENRYRLTRNFIFAIALLSLGSTHVATPRGDAYSFLIFSVYMAVFLSFTYINIYILLPRLFFKNKLWKYLVACALMVVVFLAVFLPYDYVEKMPAGFLTIFIISNFAQVALFFAGTTAVVLFQHWVRNERYIV